MDPMTPSRLSLPLRGPKKKLAEAPCLKLRRKRWFLKGPVPWGWLEQAARQPGRALHVAIALWFRSGLKRSKTVKVPRAVLSTMGVDRHAGYRGLAALERAGLVHVARVPGKSPEVTILGLEHEP